MYLPLSHPTQIIKGKRYTFSVDWWSYGVLCYEMITGQVGDCRNFHACWWNYVQYVPWKNDDVFGSIFSS